MNKFAIFAIVGMLMLINTISAYKLVEKTPVVHTEKGDVQIGKLTDFPSYYDVNENELLTFTRSISAPGLVIGINPMPSTIWELGASMPFDEDWDYAESTFTWTPAYCQNGNQYFDIQYYLNYGLQDTENVHIAVNNVNRPPEITSVVPEHVYLQTGKPFILQVDAQDIDGIECTNDDPRDSVGLEFRYNPTEIGATFEGSETSKTFYWMPVLGERGSHTIWFEATDSFEAKDEKQMVVDVYLCGDSDNNGAYNILDITYMIADKFKGGPEPAIEAAADADGNGEYNILDITYMIANKFKGGPDPICR